MYKLMIRLTIRIEAILLALALALPSPAGADSEPGRDTLRDLSVQESDAKRTGLEEGLGPPSEEFERVAREIVAALPAEVSARSRPVTLEELRGAVLAVVGRHSGFTSEHADRAGQEVSGITGFLRQKGIPITESEEQGIALGMAVHDTGKLLVPNALLGKPGPLTPEERRQVQAHPLLGAELLEEVGRLVLLGEQDAAAFKVAAQAARHHHERWDGYGYPDGLREEAIPLSARIASALDAFDAITSDRPYRAKRPVFDALIELKQLRGTQFDPSVVDALSTLHPAEARKASLRMNEGIRAGTIPAFEVMRPNELARALAGQAEQEGKARPRLVLDLGSGLGVVSTNLYEELNRAGVPCSVLGLERNAERVKEAVALAKKRGVPAEQVWFGPGREISKPLAEQGQPVAAYGVADIGREIPLPSGCADGVVLHRTHSAIQDPEAYGKVMDEAARVLKEGGLLSYVDFLYVGPQDEKGDWYARFYPINSRLAERLLETGFLPEKLRPFTQDPYRLVFSFQNADGSRVSDILQYEGREQDLAGEIGQGKIRVLFWAIQAFPEHVRAEFERRGLEVVEPLERRISIAGSGGRQTRLLRGFLFRKAPQAPAPAAASPAAGLEEGRRLREFSLGKEPGCLARLQELRRMVQEQTGADPFDPSAYGLLLAKDNKLWVDTPELQIQCVGGASVQLKKKGGPNLLPSIIVNWRRGAWSPEQAALYAAPPPEWDDPDLPEKETDKLVNSLILGGTATTKVRITDLPEATGVAGAQPEISVMRLTTPQNPELAIRVTLFTPDQLQQYLPVILGAVADLTAPGVLLPPPQGAQAGLEEVRDVVRLPDGQGEIAFIKVRPAAPGPHPVALIAHAYGMSKEDPSLRTIARRLAREGIVAVLIDLRNNRTSRNGNESSGSWREFTPRANIDDIAFVARHLAEKNPEEVDLLRTGVVGYSWGGFAARSRTALSYRKDPRDDARFPGMSVRGVVDLAGMVDPQDTFKQHLEKLLGRERAESAFIEWRSSGFIDVGRQQVRHWLPELDGYDASKDLEAIPVDVPYLYVIGKKDSLILGKWKTTPAMERFLRAMEARGEPSRVMVLDDVGHSYSGAGVPDTVLPKLADDIAAFLKPHLLSAGVEEAGKGPAAGPLGRELSRRTLLQLVGLGAGQVAAGGIPLTKAAASLGITVSEFKTMGDVLQVLEDPEKRLTHRSLDLVGGAVGGPQFLEKLKQAEAILEKSEVNPALRALFSETKEDALSRVRQALDSGGPAAGPEQVRGREHMRGFQILMEEPGQYDYWRAVDQFAGEVRDSAQVPGLSTEAEYERARKAGFTAEEYRQDALARYAAPAARRSFAEAAEELQRRGVPVPDEEVAKVTDRFLKEAAREWIHPGGGIYSPSLSSWRSTWKQSQWSTAWRHALQEIREKLGKEFPQDHVHLGSRWSSGHLWEKESRDLAELRSAFEALGRGMLARHRIKRVLREVAGELHGRGVEISPERFRKAEEEIPATGEELIGLKPREYAERALNPYASLPEALAQVPSAGALPAPPVEEHGLDALTGSVARLAEGGPVDLWIHTDNARPPALYAVSWRSSPRALPPGPARRPSRPRGRRFLPRLERRQLVGELTWDPTIRTHPGRQYRLVIPQGMDPVTLAGLLRAGKWWDAAPDASGVTEVRLKKPPVIVLPAGPARAAGLEEYEGYHGEVRRAVHRDVSKALTRFWGWSFFTEFDRVYRPDYSVLDPPRSLVKMMGTDWLGIHLHAGHRTIPWIGPRVRGNGLLFRLVLSEDGRVQGLADPMAEPRNLLPALLKDLYGFTPLRGLIPERRLRWLTKVALRLVQEAEPQLRPWILEGRAEQVLMQAVGPHDARGLYEMAPASEAAKGLHFVDAGVPTYPDPVWIRFEPAVTPPPERAAGLEEGVEQLVRQFPELVGSVPANRPDLLAKRLEEYGAIFRDEQVRQNGWNPEKVAEFLAKVRPIWAAAQEVLPDLPVCSYVNLVEAPLKETLAGSIMPRAKPMRFGLTLNLNSERDGMLAEGALVGTARLVFTAIASASLWLRGGQFGAAAEEVEAARRSHPDWSRLSEASKHRVLTARRMAEGLVDHPWFDSPKLVQMDLDDPNTAELIAVSPGLVRGGRMVTELATARMALALAAEVSRRRGEMALLDGVEKSILLEVEPWINTSEERLKARPTVEELLEGSITGEHANGKLHGRWLEDLGILSNLLYTQAILKHLRGLEVFAEGGILAGRARGLVREVLADISALKARPVPGSLERVLLERWRAADWAGISKQVLAAYEHLAAHVRLRAAGLEEKQILVIGTSEAAVSRVIETAKRRYPDIAFYRYLLRPDGGVSIQVGQGSFAGAVWLTPDVEGEWRVDPGQWAAVDGFLRGMKIPRISLREAAEEPVREAIARLLAFEVQDDVLRRIKLLHEFTSKAWGDWLEMLEKDWAGVPPFDDFLEKRYGEDPELKKAGISWVDLVRLYWDAESPPFLLPMNLREVYLYALTASIFFRLSTHYGDPERSTDADAILEALRPEFKVLPLILFNLEKDKIGLDGSEPAEVRRRIEQARKMVGLTAAGLEEGRVTVERITPEGFAQRFPEARWWDGAKGVYLAGPETASRVRFYVGHETLRQQLEEWLRGERAKLPEGMEVYLLRLPSAAGELRAPGAIVKDWMLKLPYGQQILPELEAAVGEPLPSLPTMVLFALKGAGGQVEAVIGVMKLQDAQGNTVYAYFV
ncbi:MAG: HD domain-containing protein [Candidatus Omnitrophica bacterium]|nr:HD domain-containing protein [Candidatus Omnitrophota bacterium]